MTNVGLGTAYNSVIDSVNALNSFKNALEKEDKEDKDLVVDSKEDMNSNFLTKYESTSFSKLKKTNEHNFNYLKRNISKLNPEVQAAYTDYLQKTVGKTGKLEALFNYENICFEARKNKGISFKDKEVDNFRQIKETQFKTCQQLFEHYSNLNFLNNKRLQVIEGSIKIAIFQKAFLKVIKIGNGTGNKKQQSYLSQWTYGHNFGIDCRFQEIKDALEAQRNNLEKRKLITSQETINSDNKEKPNFISDVQSRVIELSNAIVSLQEDIRVTNEALKDKEIAFGITCIQKKTLDNLKTQIEFLEEQKNTRLEEINISSREKPIKAFPQAILPNQVEKTELTIRFESIKKRWNKAFSQLSARIASFSLSLKDLDQQQIENNILSETCLKAHALMKQTCAFKERLVLSDKWDPLRSYQQFKLAYEDNKNTCQKLEKEIDVLYQNLTNEDKNLENKIAIYHEYKDTIEYNMKAINEQFQSFAKKIVQRKTWNYILDKPIANSKAIEEQPNPQKDDLSTVDKTESSKGEAVKLNIHSEEETEDIEI